MNKYIIDTSSLIDAAKNYDMKKNTFAPVWETIEFMISNQELMTSSEIAEELLDDDLKKWAKQQKGFLVPISKEIQELVTEILKRYPTLIALRSKSNSNGDPFLIATALHLEGCVVTNEKSNGKNPQTYKIPDVCREYKLECIDLIAFINRIIQ